MKILFVAGFFPPRSPASSTRAPALVRHFLDEGHEVRVLAPAHDRFPALVESGVPEGIVEWTRLWNLGWPPRVVRPGEVSKRPEGQPSAAGDPGALRRRLGRAYRTLVDTPDPTIGWVPFAVRAGRKLAADFEPDLIYVTGPPHSAHIAGRKLARQLDVPLIAEFRDLWTDDPYFHNPQLPGWRVRLEQRMERRCLQAADGIVVTTEASAAMTRGRVNVPVLTVMNGFTEEDAAVADAGSDGPARRATPLRVVHTGSIYPGRRDPALVFQALASDPDFLRSVELHFYGGSPCAISRLAADFAVESAVHVHGEVPRQDALRALSQADLALLLLWGDPAERPVIPGKLFDYIAARKPVLVAGRTEGEAPDIVAENGFGATFDTAEGIAGYLRAAATHRENGTLDRLFNQSARDGFRRSVQFAKLGPFVSEIALGKGR